MTQLKSFLSHNVSTALIDLVIKRWPTRNARDWLKQFLVEVSADANVLGVIAIGSAVRSTVDSEDLDMVAICDEKRAFNYRAPIEVDLRAFERRDVEEKLARGNDLLGWTVRFGKILYDEHGVWAETCQRWVGQLPLPDSEVARSRARTAEAQMREMLEAGDKNAAGELHLSQLTHLARATLSEAGVYPASRPELPSQLEAINAFPLAQQLRAVLAERSRERAVKPAV